MTRRQRHICRTIRRYGNLNIVLKKCKIPDYMELQYLVDDIEFSDSKMNENTTLTLGLSATEELEHRQERVIDVWTTRIMAFVAIVISIIALLAELGILRLR